MTLLFDRSYSLIIGKPVVNISVPKSIALKEGFTATEWQSGSDWVKSNSGGALEITDLQITANIKNTSNNSSSASKTTITIANMSDSTRSVVEEVGNYIILKAGYKQDEELKLIFTGQVSSFETTRAGADLITTLVCTDAYTPNNSIRVSKKFSSDQTWKDVITYLISAYGANGVPLGDFVSDWTSSKAYASANKIPLAEVQPQNYVQLPVMTLKPANTKLSTGYSAMGWLHQIMKNVCEQIGYVSYISNGSLFVHPKGFTQMVEQYEFTSSQIKSIRKVGTQQTNSVLGKGIAGIKLKTFLDGRIAVDKRLKILDGEYEGSYKIISTQYDLDYENGAWDVTAELQREGD